MQDGISQLSHSVINWFEGKPLSFCQGDRRMGKTARPNFKYRQNRLLPIGFVCSGPREQRDGLIEIRYHLVTSEHFIHRVTYGDYSSEQLTLLALCFPFPTVSQALVRGNL